MAKLEKSEPQLRVCQGNAERLVKSAKEVRSASGSNQVAVVDLDEDLTGLA
jgi:hypothetical protein